MTHTLSLTLAHTHTGWCYKIVISPSHGCQHSNKYARAWNRIKFIPNSVYGSLLCPQNRFLQVYYKMVNKNNRYGVTLILISVQIMVLILILVLTLIYAVIEIQFNTIEDCTIQHNTLQQNIIHYTQYILFLLILLLYCLLISSKTL